MEKHEIIRELAQAVYNDNLKHNVRNGEKEDWQKAERLYDFYESKGKPRVYSWEWGDEEKFFNTYLRCKDDGRTS